MPTTDGGRGLFISFEGLDGCGKTTQLVRLARRLRGLGYRVVETVEPGGTPIGEQIRQILLDVSNAGMAPMTEALLYFASRVQNLEECIRPALGRGEIVLADRYTDSTIAYQGYGRQLGAGTIEQLHQIACGGLQPDLTLWLDLPLEAALARLSRRNAGWEGTAASQTRMDTQPVEFYQRVQEGYRALASKYPHRIQRVDATGDPATVEERVWQAVARLLRSHRVQDCELLGE